MAAVIGTFDERWRVISITLRSFIQTLVFSLDWLLYQLDSIPPWSLKSKLDHPSVSDIIALSSLDWSLPQSDHVWALTSWPNSSDICDQFPVSRETVGTQTRSISTLKIRLELSRVHDRRTCCLNMHELWHGINWFFRKLLLHSKYVSLLHESLGFLSYVEEARKELRVLDYLITENPFKVRIDSEGYLERFRKTLHRGSFIV